jgi:hypothetical protein
VATLVAFPSMMERDRRREGLRVCRAAWLLGQRAGVSGARSGDALSDSRDLECDLRAARMAADVRRLTNVSAVQSQAAQPPKVDRRVPWYVYLVATLLLGWNTLVLSVLVSEKDFDYPFWRVIAPVALQIVIGCGLLFRRRWAWTLGVTTSVVFVAEGLRRLLFVHFEYEWAVALIDYFAPAIGILVCLLPGRARRAFLGEGQSDVG